MNPTLTQTLTVPQAAEQRHSIRKYEPTPIPMSDLREILRLTGLAPSAFNAQPWRFVVVTDAHLKQQVCEAAHNQQQVANAAAVFVLYSDMKDTLAHLEDVIHPGMPAERREAMKNNIQGLFGSMPESDREAFGASQAYIALGYLVLTAQSLGYASNPMSGFDADKLKQILGLPSYSKIAAIVPMGIGAESGFPHHRLGVDRIATFR